jgi:hypothetical protein
VGVGSSPQLEDVAADVKRNRTGDYNMNREALEQTIRVLKRVKEEQLGFDLHTFVGITKERKGESVNHSLSYWSAYTGDGGALVGGALAKAKFAELYTDQDPDIRIPHACGCTACATGYAGLDTWFRARGFVTRPNGTVAMLDPDTREVINVEWDGMAQFYELDDLQAQYLFMPQPYNDPTDPQGVIDRIESVLRDGFPAEEDMLRLVERNPED